MKMHHSPASTDTNFLAQKVQSLLLLHRLRDANAEIARAMDSHPGDPNVLRAALEVARAQDQVFKSIDLSRLLVSTGCLTKLERTLEELRTKSAMGDKAKRTEIETVLAEPMTEAQRAETASVLCGVKAFEDARKVIGSARDRESRAYRLALARIFLGTGKFDEAEARVRSQIEEDLKDYEAWILLSEIKAHDRDYRNAVSIACHAAAIAPERPQAYFRAAQALYRLRLPRDAMTAIEIGLWKNDLSESLRTAAAIHLAQRLRFRDARKAAKGQWPEVETQASLQDLVP
jgi:tetratricopeptide (TPR) repeat protein